MRRPRFVLSCAMLAASILTATLVVAPAADAADGLPGLGSLTGCSTTYFDGDSRLGPEQLPKPVVSEVGDEVLFYQRTGGETVPQFLAQYYDPAANGGMGSYIYPPANGFVVDAAGHPEEAPQTLPVGQLLDRYGSEFGGFLAIYGTPYGQRSIPPSNLDTADPNYTCNFHAYRVSTPFDVEAGPAAPWFAQPGEGEQYQIDGALLPGKPARPNVKYLIDNGYLERLN